MAQIMGSGAPFCRVLDINSLGVRLTATQPVKVGEQLVIALRFAEIEEEMHLTGCVVWIDDTGEIGVEFQNLEDDYKWKLRRLIDELKKITQEYY